MSRVVSATADFDFCILAMVVADVAAAWVQHRLASDVDQMLASGQGETIAPRGRAANNDRLMYYSSSIDEDTLPLKPTTFRPERDHGARRDPAIGTASVWAGPARAETWIEPKGVAVGRRERAGGTRKRS